MKAGRALSRRGWVALAGALASTLTGALAGLLALGLGQGPGLGLNPPEAPLLPVGRSAPAFALPRLDDATRLLRPADLQGRVWVLNVWASWCAPCRDEHPLLVQAAHAQQVLLVGLSHRDDPRDATEWLLRLGNPYWATAVDRDGRVSASYGVQGVPQTLVIDRQGVVRHRHVGPLTQQVWERDVLPLVQRLQG